MYEIRPIVDGEYDRWVRASILGFNAHVPEGYSELIRPTVALDRTFGAFEGDEIVGATRSKEMEMTVPGGVLPCAVVEDVSVLPTHRRRGILTRMMDLQLKDLCERGEPLAALNSTESIIYGRYGYGVGAFRDDWSINRQHTAFERPVDPVGQVRLVDRDEAMELYPGICDLACGGRPGYLRPGPNLWRMHLVDPEF